MSWLPAWDEQAKTLVHDVMAEPVPPLEFAYPGTSGGGNWRFPDRRDVHGRHGRATPDTAEGVLPYATDCRRRCRVAELAEERGWPTEVRDLAWLLLPYKSVPLRWGWDAFSAIEAGKTTEAAIEEHARRWRERFLGAA